MRIAVISDIHGNDLALEAVLADIDAQGIDEIVNLGDHLSGPLNAARTAEILIGRRTAAIRGNHDRYLLTLGPARMGLSDRSAHDDSMSTTSTGWPLCRRPLSIGTLSFSAMARRQATRPTGWRR